MTAHSEKLRERVSVFQIARQLPRGDFFAGLFALACISGLASRMIQSIDRLGWMDALLSTFDVSAIVWVSCAAGVVLVLRDRSIGISSLDLAIGGAFLCLVVLPIGPLSWLAITALALYLVAITSRGATSRRGALILLAVTVPMLWSRLLFKFFATPILEIDASLVGWILGTNRAGTVIESVDASGVLVVLPACSSLANVSLAFLCWVTVSQWVKHKTSVYDLAWCLLACMSVIAVNVMRLSLMGLSEWHHAVLHAGWGDAIFNTLITVLIIGFAVMGVRRERFRRV